MGGLEQQNARSLRARLESAIGGAQTARAAIALSTNGRRTCAAVGASARAEEEPFRTGCVTKLFVAALLERKLRRHRLGYDMPIERALQCGPGAEAFGATTFRHLLEHTHGLDDSDVAAAPLHADGRIDLERLLARLRARRFASPGRIYSYSNAGAWIVAAVLERLERLPFRELLRDDLFRPLGLNAHGLGRRAPGGTHTCPATGGELAVTVADLLTFLEASAAKLPSAPPTAPQHASRRSTPLPGWHPLERGVHLGWKQYGGGWWGHQSIWPGASLMLGAHPRNRSALVVASDGPRAAVVAAKVLGRELPELFALSLPRPLSAGAAARLDPMPYCGRYACAAESLVVEAAGSEGLVLRSHRSSARLIPANDDVFFLETASADRAFVQLIGREGAAFRLLWDGRRVLALAESSRRDPRRDARREARREPIDDRSDRRA